MGVTNGLFTVTLDFGGVFTGNPAWLAIAVRTNGSTNFTALNPLQELTPTPYAVFAGTAGNLSGTLTSAQISGAYSNAVTFSNSSNNFSGAFSGNGSGLTNLPASNLAGTISPASLPPLATQSFAPLFNPTPLAYSGPDTWLSFQIPWLGTVACAWARTNVWTTNADGSTNYLGLQSECWLTNAILILAAVDPNHVYHTIGLTDGTFPLRDTNGNLMMDSNFFHYPPSWYTAFAASNGIQLVAYTSVSPITCEGYPGLGISNAYRDIYWLYSNGFAGTVVDDCAANLETAAPLLYHQQVYTQIRQAVSDFVFTNSEAGKTIKPFVIIPTPYNVNETELGTYADEYFTAGVYAVGPTPGLEDLTAISRMFAVPFSSRGLWARQVSGAGVRLRVSRIPGKHQRPQHVRRGQSGEPF